MKQFINLSLITGIVAFLLTSSCEHSTEPRGNLDFQKMEIHYIKEGGWINTSKLDIYDNGSASAYLLSHASNNVLDSALTVLSKEKQYEIADLFQSFSSYKRYYEPKPEDWATDQNIHTIILFYDGVPDTVSVYMPEKANIPLSLTKIIAEMESLWAIMLEK